MKTSKETREELVSLLSKSHKIITNKWVSQIMEIGGHRRHKSIVPAAKHKSGMARYFKFLTAFIKNRHDARSFKCLTSLIRDGYLGINNAEDVIHGQMLLRKIISDFLVLIYKKNPRKLREMTDLVDSAVNRHILHISSTYRKRDFSRMHTLFKSGRKLVAASDVNKLLEVVLESAAKESNADRASIMLIDKRGVLKINTSIGIPEDIVEEAQALIGKSIAGKVAKTKRPVIINEGDKQTKEIKRFMHGLNLASSVCIPIATENSEVLGVLNLGKYHGKAPFDIEDVELLSILAYEAAASIKSCQLVMETEGLYVGTIFALAAALDARDHYTHGHSRKVSRYAISIARQLKLAPYQIDIVRRASLLHDIGKIGIPDKILNKPAKLTDKEFDIVKKHPEVALNILRPIPQLKDVLPAIYHEHERYDGRGYIIGLRGDAIPVEARVIGVADAFDAMTSSRPYRKPLSKKAATKELKRCAGTQFDPEVVKAFLKVLNKK